MRNLTHFVAIFASVARNLVATATESNAEHRAWQAQHTLPENMPRQRMLPYWALIQVAWSIARASTWGGSSPLTVVHRHWNEDGETCWYSIERVVYQQGNGRYVRIDEHSYYSLVQWKEHYLPLPWFARIPQDEGFAVFNNANFYDDVPEGGYEDLGI